MFSLPFRTTFVFVALASALASADSHEHTGRRHHALNLERNTHLEKRFDNTRFTYFPPGINACGGYDHDNDFIVALNTHQWDGGSHCFEEITVSYQGKTAKAKITDMCEECPYGAIDFSPGLFTYLIPGGFDQGVAYGSWYYGAAEEPKPKPTPEEKPETKTTTSTKYTSTTTSKAEPTSTTTHSESTTSSHKTSTTTPTTTPTAPTTTVTSFDNGNLNQFNMAMIQLAEMMLASSNDA
ncbi:hypothetical protein C8Q80DRAFT_1270399 [Daedaleopsis nitida]|nr:hypothetical protein C8Q80DRAFT_1270399 [Daedaleopsis nitida]